MILTKGWQILPACGLLSYKFAGWAEWPDNGTLLIVNRVIQCVIAVQEYIKFSGCHVVEPSTGGKYDVVFHTISPQIMFSGRCLSTYSRPSKPDRSLHITMEP